MRGNTIEMRLEKGRVGWADSLYQYDYGQRLILTGVELPVSYEVHFSNQENGQSKTMIGDSTGVDIPDEYLLTGKSIHVWVYLHDGTDDGETEYHGMIGVTGRAQPTDQQPTPVQQDVITQTIAALNAGVEAAETAQQAWENMSATAETLPEGSAATANYANGVLSIGVPVGATGAQGAPGKDGVDGFSPSASVSKSGNTATISITDKDGPTSAQISDGQDGATGATPVISIGTVSKLSPGSNPTASMDTTDPEHPVLSLGLVTGDTGEVTQAEFDALQIAKADIITDTASGAIASFPDGADGMPVQSLSVAVEPVQDLHGQESPWPAGGGKNLLPDKFYNGGNYNQSAGTTFTLTELQDVTKTGDDYLRSVSSWGGMSMLSNPLEAGTYKVSITYSATSGTRSTLYVLDENFTVSRTIANSSVDGSWTNSITLSETEKYIFVWLGSNAAATVKFSKPMITAGSSSETFAPYSNICPISGWTGANVTRTGVNVWDEEWEVGSYTANGAKTYATDRIRSKNQIEVLAGTNYYFKRGSGNTIMFYIFLDEGGQNRNGSILQLGQDGIITAPSWAKHLLFYTAGAYGTTYNHDISINYPATDTQYHAYSGTTYPISFPSEAGTVYGGTLTVNEDGTGTLVVDRVSVDLSTITWTYMSTATRPYFRSYDEFVSMKPCTGGAIIQNMLCSQYKSETWSHVLDTDGYDKCICEGWIGKSYIAIRDTDYTDATTFTTAMSGVQLVYELATPVTYQLTNQQVIETLKSINNVWADTGDTTVTYRADTKAYINKQLSASQKLMELIVTANREESMKATKAYSSGNLLIVNGTLYKATTSIANGANLTVGTNVTATTVANEIALLA